MTPSPEPVVGAAAPYTPRLLEPILAEDLDTFPVVVLTGARQAGKSTLAREGEPSAARPYFTLDDFSVLDQARKAPEELLARHPTMTLDEVQREPSLLLIIKAIVDRHRPRRAGQFLLTGSANLALMDAVGDSLAGRAAYRVLHPMTRREQRGLGCAGLWGDLFREPIARWPELLQDDDVGAADWRALAERGGLPVPAVELETSSARAAWFESYVRTYLERDLRDLTNVQNLPDFRRLMRAASLRLGGLLNQSELARDVGLPSSTVQRYLGLLETSHLLVRLEPYSVNRSKRLIKAPKLYWADTGLALHLAGTDPSGPHLENLLLCDLLAWSESVRSARPQILYWRSVNGQEVDLVIELGDRLLAIEVKASGSPSHADAKHLRTFRDEYEDVVHGCLLLHNGTETFRMDERIVATPWWRVV